MVVLKTIRLQDNKISIQVFFIDYLSLNYALLMDYYALRFQRGRPAIEFEFRDVKQHFGLADFKNYTAKNLTNFVNLSLLR